MEDREEYHGTGKMHAYPGVPADVVQILENPLRELVTNQPWPVGRL